MATLLIEGDPGAIRWLWAELDERSYLSSEFTVIEIEWNALPAPDLLAACKAALADSLTTEGFNCGYCRFCGAYVYSDHPKHFGECPVPLLRAAIAKAKPGQTPDAQQPAAQAALEG